MLALCAFPAVALAVPCSQVFVFQTGQVLTASNLNANPANFVSCVNNIDNTNIGTAGLYASQIVPTNSSQATFGGSQAYTFPSGLSSTVIGTNGGINLVNNTASAGQTPGTPWIANDGGGIKGINFNVPTSASFGWRFLTNDATAQATISSNGQLTLSGPALATESGFSTAAPMPPMYTTSGAAAAGTLHGVVWSCTLVVGSCGVTLTGAAVFSSVSSYGCFANTQATPVATFYISPSSASGFTVTTSSGTGSGVASGACIGT